MRFVASVTIATGLAACGNGERIAPENLVSVGSGQFRIAGGSCPRNSAGALTGTCRLVSPVNLGGIDSGKSFAIRFALADGGSIAFHAYAATDLAGGVDLKFWREGGTLRFSGTIAGQTVDHSRRFANFDPREPVSLQIDVHNNEAPAHVIIWPASAGPAFDVNAKLVNTALCGIGNNPNYDCSTQWGTAAGTGASFGISLVNAALYSADISPPKYVE